MAPAAAEVLILDTDHMSELARGSAPGMLLRQRLTASGDRRGTSSVSLDELLRGHLAQIAAAKDDERLITVYGRFQKAVAGLSGFTIMAWDAAAAAVFDKLRQHRLRIGTMDLRIAAIARANNATLLSRNLKDFERVPELKVEDWLS